MNVYNFTKSVLTSTLLLFAIFNGFAGTGTLTFRVANPRIFFSSGTSRLEFEIQVKSSVARYADGLQANFFFSSAAFSSSPALSSVLAGISIQSGIEGTMYASTATTLGNRLNYYLTPNHQWGSGDDLSQYYALINTDWTTLVKLRVTITDKSQESGIYFDPTNMLLVTNQSYVDPILGPTQRWATIASDETKYLRYLYLGRIYSAYGGGSWTQFGVASTDWSVAENTSVWDTATAAASLSTASSQAGKLRIHNAARLKITETGQLTCTGATEINETDGLWIASSASGTGSFIDNGTITYNGTAKIQRWIGHDHWHYVGFPVHTVMARASLLQLYVKYYDETRSVPYVTDVPAKWRYVIDALPAPDSSLSTMRGYAIWSDNATTGDKTLNFEGTGSNNLYTGAQSTTLTRTAFTSGDYANDGWNLVANYYPSAIDWEAASGWSRTNIDPTAYFWDDANQRYASYNYSSHASNNGGTRYIPAMQGYFVHVNAGTSTTLGTDNQVRISNAQAFWKNEQDYNDHLILLATANGFTDESQVIFDSDATTDFDPMFDAYKLTGGTDAPQLYTVTADNNLTSVNFLPWTGIYQVVPLNFSCGLNGTYSITASNMSSFRTGIEIYLEDKQVTGNAWPDLRTNPVYQFSYTTGEDPNRFILHFTNVYFGISDPTVNAMQIYSYEDFVYVKNITSGNTQGDVFIYDLTGRKIFQDKLQNNLINKYRISVNEGYYLVNVITPDNTYHQKVYLK